MCLAVPGKLLSAEEIGNNRLGVVDLGGSQRQVFLDFIPEAQVGDFVLVHAGFAISRLDEAEARETRELLERIGMIEAGVQAPVAQDSDEYDGAGVGSHSLRFCGGWPVQAVP
jgi:hydrogenase expression/formation protein HypC